jgi:hypothetical protein
MNGTAPAAAESSDTTELAVQPSESAPPSIPPLGVSGLIVSKVDLIAALRTYVPQLVDIAPLDATRFELILTAPDQGQE